MTSDKIYILLLFLIGIINFLPVIGVISTNKINKSYGLSIQDNDLAILLRHRALLFGILGGFVFYSIFNPQYQTAAMTLTGISMVGYLYFYWSVSNANNALSNIAHVDTIGLILLLIETSA